MSQYQEALFPNRLSTFKNKGKDLEEMRRRRSTATIELRKANRDEQMLKRRNISLIGQQIHSNENSSTQNSRILSIEEILQGLKSNDEDLIFNAIHSARRILSSEKNPPISTVIEAGIVPFCVELLSDKYSSKLQFEAAWALTNIASGTTEHTNEIIKAGAVPKLVNLLKSSDFMVAEQAVWTLGNIAGDGPESRDVVIAANVFPAILSLAESKISISMLRNVMWTISNFCRNKNPPPPFNAVEICLPTLHKILSTSTDDETLADTCWALSYLTDGPNHQIQAVVDTNIVPRLVELLSSNVSQLLTPALRAVGNIVTGNEEQTDSVIHAGALHKLRELLFHKKQVIVKEATWSISNIAAGTPSQIQAIIDANILPALVAVLESGDFKSQKEAAWAVTNFTTGANIQQLSELINCGALPPFCNLLDSKDSRVVLVVLDGIQNILSKAEGIGKLDRIATMIEECGGLDKLENLQNHEMQQVYEKAYSIIDAYYNPEAASDVAIEQLGGQYVFNAETPSNEFSF